MKKTSRFFFLVFSLLLGSLALISSIQNPPASARVIKPQKAVFAGGCFWCLEASFEKVPGVIDATSGFAGGHLENPTYEQVSGEETGHAEAVQILFDPTQVTYEQLLDVYWQQIDPTDAGGQFVDRGPQYRALIFVANPAQEKAARESKEKLEKSGRYKKPIVTEIQPFTVFYRADESHQNFYKKFPDRYQYYRDHSGR